MQSKHISHRRVNFMAGGIGVGLTSGAQRFCG